MATQPTKNPVPSESPRDLKFNAGKIDEFVTSLVNTYIDRFGHEHYTIEGLRWMAQQAIAQYGWIPFGTFQSGATLTLPTQILKDTTNGEYYRWDGSFLPSGKIVPQDSNPSSTGGFGVGKWLSVGDSLLRSELSNGVYRSDATALKYVPGVVINNTTNNRDAVYTFAGKIYVPFGVQFRCNFLPGDDVTKFIGGGKILTRDPWGNEHVFDVGLATNGTSFTALGTIAEYANKQGTSSTIADCKIGILGDSITDGAYSKDWNPNPTDAGGNLNSTNYNHNLNGGKYSWFRVFTDCLNMLSDSTSSIFKGYNCASSGKALATGWGYVNFDYGFFQNADYGRTAPDVLFVSLGFNDNGELPGIGFEAYLHEFEKLIRKSWGYGCPVCFVTMNNNDAPKAFLELSIKKRIERLFPKVEFLDISKATTDAYADIGDYSIADVAKRDGGTVFDQSHPSTIGHSYLGAYAAKEVFKERVYLATKNKNLIPTTQLSFVGFGFPSGVRYNPTIANLSGSDYLDALGGWGMITPASENVTCRYFIWSDVSDVSLNIFEPFNPTYTTSDRTNSYTVILNDIRNASYMSGALASSGVSTFSGKQTTLIGTLKKGLNIISISYGGTPSKLYPPGLLFREQTKTCYIGFGFVNLSPGQIKGMTGGINPINDLTLGYNLSSPDDESPDMIMSTKSSQVNVVELDSMPVGTIIIFNYKQKQKSGCAVGRSASGTLSFYTLNGNALTSIGTATADLSGKIRAIKGGDNITIYPTTGSTQTQSINGYSGGKACLMNNSSSNITVTLSSFYSRAY